MSSLPLPSLTPGKPWPQSPTLFYHSPDARKKNLNPLGRAALFTGKTCALPSLQFWEYECRCSWKASKYLVHRGKSLHLNFRPVTEERNSKKQQMRSNMGSCTDPSVIFTCIPYHQIRADDTTLVSNCVVSVDAQVRNGLQCVGYTAPKITSVIWNKRQELKSKSEETGRSWRRRWDYLSLDTFMVLLNEDNFHLFSSFTLLLLNHQFLRGKATPSQEVPWLCHNSRISCEEQEVVWKTNSKMRFYKERHFWASSWAAKAYLC